MTLKKTSLYVAVVALGFVLGLIASGCIDSTATCNNGLKACGDTCADVSADKNNCGGCGLACALGQVCQEGACVCQPGTEACGGACVVTQSDADNCGACGNACPTGQVCEAGACKSACSLGGACDGACVDLQNDALNCGTCGNACDTAQSCQHGTCTQAGNAVAACFNGGTLVPIQPDTLTVGARKPVGTGPYLLAGSGPVVFSADVDGQVHQARTDTLAEVGTPASLQGSDPQGLVSAPPYLYAVEDSTNALTVFRTSDAGTLDAGFGLSAVGGYSFGESSGAHAPVLVGSVLYVPKFGNLFAADGGVPGVSVAKVDVSDPAHPADAGTIDLSGLDLQSFDGGTTYPQPASAVALNGKVYFPLQNLTPAYGAGGPGLLARYDPADGGVSAVALGGASCLEPSAAVPVDGKLVVSCAGDTDYTNYPVVTTSGSALVLVDGDQAVATWAPTCPSTGSDCQDPSLGRLAAVGNRVLVGDQSAGRVFVVDVTDGGFQEVRGYATDGGPLQVCAGADGGGAGQLVSDVAVIPSQP